MRPISAEGFAPPTADFAPGAAPMLQWVRIAELVVDEGYQRPIQKTGRKNIAAIAEQFCWSKFAPILVSPVEGGFYAVIDGQHRATAAALRGLETLPAMVIIADTVEQAAAFKAVNGQVTQMNALALHKAAVAAGDPRAVELAEVCAAAGVRILTSTPGKASLRRPRETMAVGALAKGIDRHGPAVVRQALLCLTQTANDRAGVLCSLVLESLFPLIAEVLADTRVSSAQLVFAFNRINVLREMDKALAEPRTAGEPRRDVLRRRLAARLAEALAKGTTSSPEHKDAA